MLDITHMDGYELLTPEERRLCSEVHLEPRHWLTVKDTVLKEAYARGFIQKTPELLRMGKQRRCIYYLYVGVRCSVFGVRCGSGRDKMNSGGIFTQ